MVKAQMYGVTQATNWPQPNAAVEQPMPVLEHIIDRLDRAANGMASVLTDVNLASRRLGGPAPEKADCTGDVGETPGPIEDPATQRLLRIAKMLEHLCARGHSINARLRELV